MGIEKTSRAWWTGNWNTNPNYIESEYTEGGDLKTWPKKTQSIIPDDPTLKIYMDDATNDINIDTKPSGAKISYKPYKDVNGKWIVLGVTPIDKVRVPVGMHRWRIQKEGYHDRELASSVLLRDAFSVKQKELIKSNYGDPLKFHWNLYEKNSVPAGSIGIDRGKFQIGLRGIWFNPKGMMLDQFFIDRTEVTNRDYKKFVDSGGYANPKFWKPEFEKGGQVIPWAEAMKLFVDQTGQTGPSTWELGDYPEGPVNGKGSAEKTKAAK